MKKILLAFILSFVTFTSQAEMKTYTVKDVCNIFGNIAFMQAFDYLTSGLDKEAQLQKVRETAYPRYPFLKGFEPGLIISLDTLMASRSLLDEMPSEKHLVTAEQFQRTIVHTCVVDQTQGWLQTTERVFILNGKGPDISI